MKNNRNTLLICGVLAALGIAMLTIAGNQQDLSAQSVRGLQTNNYSSVQIDNWEHNHTLGAKQVSILDADGNTVSAFGGATAQAEYRSPSDFTATFASGTTLTLASLPIALTDDSQLVYVKVVPASGDAALYINGSAGVTMRESGGTLTIAGAGTTPFVTGDAYEVGINLLPRGYDSTLKANAVKILDDTGAQLTSFVSPATVATHRSPSDFSATYTSNVTLTLASLPIAITDDSQLVYIRVVPASGSAATYINGASGVTMREAANVVTISGAGTPFAAGDVYEVGLNLQDKGYDLTNDLNKIQEQSPVWDRRTDVATISVTPQAFTTSWVDFGAEQDTRGYNTACIWMTVDINDSLNPRVRLLAKHTSAGPNEYEFPINTESASDVKVEGQYYEFNVDEDQLVVECWDLGNAIPYIQLQLQAGTAGASPGTLFAAYITKGY